MLKNKKSQQKERGKTKNENENQNDDNFRRNNRAHGGSNRRGRKSK